jgi:hypothetical protein
LCPIENAISPVSHIKNEANANGASGADFFLFMAEYIAMKTNDAINIFPRFSKPENEAIPVSSLTSPPPNALGFLK